MFSVFHFAFFLIFNNSHLVSNFQMSEEDQSAPNGSVPGPDAKAWPELTVDLEPEVWR